MGANFSHYSWGNPEPEAVEPSSSDKSRTRSIASSNCCQTEPTQTGPTPAVSTVTACPANWRKSRRAPPNLLRFLYPRGLALEAVLGLHLIEHLLVLEKG